MLRKILLATVISVFPLAAQADGMYAGVEAGGSYGDISVSRNIFTSSESNSLGYDVGGFFGYEKDLKIAIAPKRGNDAVRFEGLLGYRGYNYNSSKRYVGKFGSSVSSDVSSLSFIPGIHYDAKSLYLYKNDKINIYPTASAGVGFSYNKLQNTRGNFGFPGFSTSYRVSKQKLRRESLETLTQRYISEAMRLEFSKTEIRQVINDQLKAWNEAEEIKSE